MDARQAVEIIERGGGGASVRGLRMSGMTPERAHERLLKKGFTCVRLPISAERTRTNEPQWRTRVGVTTARETAASEYVYIHADGGAVRVFPERGPSVGFDELGGTELGAEPTPFARKSVMGGTGYALADEIAVVTESGNLLPKSLRVEDGLKYEDSKKVEGFVLARAVLEEQRIPLLPAPPSRVLQRIPFTERRGLLGGITLVPKGDFWQAAKTLLHDAKQADPAVLVREQAASTNLFFAGEREVAAMLRKGCVGLASLAIHTGAYVLSVDPNGYQASVNELLAFMLRNLPRLTGVTAYDNFSGKDVSLVLERRPALVLHPNDATGVVLK